MPVFLSQHSFAPSQHVAPQHIGFFFSQQKSPQHFVVLDLSQHLPVLPLQHVSFVGSQQCEVCAPGVPLQHVLSSQVQQRSGWGAAVSQSGWSQHFPCLGTRRRHLKGGLLAHWLTPVSQGMPQPTCCAYANRLGHMAPRMTPPIPPATSRSARRRGIELARTREISSNSNSLWFMVMLLSAGSHWQRPAGRVPGSPRRPWRQFS
jgi:hypothetical protein